MPVLGKKLVVCTPAGRRRYLEILARHVLSDPGVDEWRLWANTPDPDDLAWMHALAAAEPRVNVHLPSWPHEGNFSIHRYFPLCCDPDAVYVRCDDDVVWAGKTGSTGHFTRLATRRIAQPGPFLLFGNVVNNGITSHLNQRAGRLPEHWGRCEYDCTSAVGWNSPDFALDLHRHFLRNPSAYAWELADWKLWDYERYSVTVFSWLGSDFARFGGQVGKDEEVWLSVERPKEEGRANVIAGDCVFAHYASRVQRAKLDADPEILKGYRKLAGLE